MWFNSKLLQYYFLYQPGKVTFVVQGWKISLQTHVNVNTRNKKNTQSGLVIAASEPSNGYHLSNENHKMLSISQLAKASYKKY